MAPAGGTQALQVAGDLSGLALDDLRVGSAAIEASIADLFGSPAISGTVAAARKPRVRDAEATKTRILEAAKREFAKNGLGGARVDVIAEKARANKRMIYHYFESKEGLFQTILENAYVDIRTAEQKLNLDHLAPKLPAVSQRVKDHHANRPRQQAHKGRQQRP